MGLAFLDIALRQNHIRRLTERLTLKEHLTARLTTEVDISLSMLDHEQREAGLLYQRIRSRGAPTVISTEGESASVGSDDVGVEPVMWVPVSLARRSHAPVDVINGEGAKLARLTQFETSRLLASAMYRLLRLILLSHPDAKEQLPNAQLYNVLHRHDKPRWLVQAALLTLLTERTKPAASSLLRPRAPDTVTGVDAECRADALDIFDRYKSTLLEFFDLLDLAVNDYLLVVALNPSQDEHLLAFDSPLHVQHRSRRLWPRLTSGAYWVEYRTRLPGHLRAYHLVAQTEEGLEIDTMSLISTADDSVVKGLAADLTTLADQLTSEVSRPRGRRGEKMVELELQGCLRRLSELTRRRRWEASKARLRLSHKHSTAVHALEHAATAGEAQLNIKRQPHSSLFHHKLVTPQNLQRAASEIVKQEFHRDLSLESEPASTVAHVYWRRHPSRVDLKNSIDISADMFIKDASGSRPGIIVAYVFGVVGISYLLGALRFGALWPLSDSSHSAVVANADAIIAVLLLVPGFLYTRLNLPLRESIAGQLRRVPRMVAQITITAAAILAAAFAASDNATLIRIVLGVCVAVPMLAVAVMLIAARAIPRDMLPVTAKLPVWARTAWRSSPGTRWRDRMAGIWWQRGRTLPDAVFSTTSLEPDGTAQGSK